MMWLEGCPEAAEQAWQKGHELVRQSPAAGAYEFDRWCYQRLREVLDGRETRTETPPSLPTDTRQLVALQESLGESMRPHPSSRPALA